MRCDGEGDIGKSGDVGYNQITGGKAGEVEGTAS